MNPTIERVLATLKRAAHWTWNATKATGRALWTATKFVARWTWKGARAVVLALSYVFLFLPTLLLRMRKKRNERHAELVAAIKESKS